MNAFVDYLNSMNNASGDTAAALAESQVLSEFYKKIQIKRKLGTYLANRIRSDEKLAIVLTGHAGDGKTSILVQVLQELGFLHPGEALAPEKTYSNEELSLYAVKDMSELSEDSQIAFCRKALDAPRNDMSSVIVSNTGPLLKCLEQIRREQCQSEGRAFDEAETINLQTRLLDQLDKNLNQKITVGDYSFLMINIARVDNVGFATDILDKILALDLWQPCQECPKKAKCSICFNVMQLRKNSERVKAFINAFYRNLYENDKRMTIRQMMAQLSFGITGNRSCSDIKIGANPTILFDNLFSNLFFGYRGIEEIDHTDQIQGIAYARNLGLDSKGLGSDYRLFVTGDFTCFPSEIQELIQKQHGLFSQRHINIDAEDREFSSEDYEYRKAIRRAYIFFGDANISGDNDYPLFDELFGDGYGAFVRIQNNQANKTLLNTLGKTITEALYLEMTGTSSKTAKEIPLTIKRSDDSFQVIMLTTGYLKKAKFKVKGIPVGNEFEDRDLKCDVVLEIDGDYQFTLTLPMIVYFGELANGMISTICNPSLTHGISKLKANLIKIAAEDTEEDEISIIVNRTDEAKNMKIQIEDKLYFE